MVDCLRFSFSPIGRGWDWFNELVLRDDKGGAMACYGLPEAQKALGP